jgi:rSAM/selenodomain-associated transferase 1
MARVPAAGRVKTRLARTVGVVEATRFYRTTARTVSARLARAPFWETSIAVTPDIDRSSPFWPAGVRTIGQGGGDLGRRMQRPMQRLGPGPVCVVGTDIPGIRVADVRRAFRALGAADAAFGPASDGGFWLVGLRRRPRLVEPYRDVGWSRSDTLAAVLRNLAGCRVGLTTVLDDVDDAADLVRARPLVGRRVLPLCTLSN